MYKNHNDREKRTITCRMSGFMREDEMQEWADEYKRETDTYEGGPHLVLADMRGLKPAKEKVSEIMMEAIGYARERGVAACAHISDSTISRLQAARIAREASPHDDVTMDVVSIEEAHRVLDEARERLNVGA